MGPASANFVIYERTLDDGTDLLSLEGATAPAAAARVKSRLGDLKKKKRPRVIVDLSRVSFVDAGLVEVLAGAAKDATRGGRRIVVVEPVDPMTARPLEMGRLDLVADVVPTLAAAARSVGLPEERLKVARPAPAPMPEPSKPKRTMFGRRRQDQDLMQELAQLRRFAQEMRRERGMHEEVTPDELARRRAAEEELIRAGEADARARAEEGDESASAAAEELAKARAQIEEFRQRAVSAQAQSTRMEEEAEEAHARVQTLEAALERARAEAARMEDEAERAHARIQALERELEGAAAAAARVAALEAEAAELRAQLEQARAAAAVAANEDDERLRADEERRHAEAEQARLAAERARAEEERRRAEEEAEREDGRARAEEERRRAEEAGRARAEEERRRAEEAGRARAEEERRRAEEAAKPRPRVPVWADPTPINLNTADLDELMLLPGIGRRPAERILSFREERGSFGTIEDLWQVPDVPRDRLSKIRPYVRV